MLICCDQVADIWSAVVKHLVWHGRKEESRNGPCREILNVQIEAIDSLKNFTLSSTRKLNANYACAETLWYLSGSCDVTRLAEYAPSYFNFAENNSSAYGAYGPRIIAQLERIVLELKTNKNSRQCVIPIFDQGDLRAAGVAKDVPCTLSLQFLIRGDKLHLRVNMRSNDGWLGLPYDVFAFTCIQKLIADELQIIVGSYTHCVGSMHLYEKHVEKAANAVMDSKVDIAHGWTDRDCIELGLTTARCWLNKTNITPRANSMVDDLYRVCVGQEPLSPVLKRGMKQ